MPTQPTNKDAFASIEPAQLEKVAGGASRTSSSDAQITAMLSSITSSIKDLAGANSGTDPMTMMIMMMMMGGGGGGGGGYVAGGGAVAGPPVINVDTGVSGGGGGYIGGRGWILGGGGGMCGGGGCRGKGKGKKGW